jgi:hypothetical protein
MTGTPTATPDDEARSDESDHEPSLLNRIVKALAADDEAENENLAYAVGVGPDTSPERSEDGSTR